MAEHEPQIEFDQKGNPIIKARSVIEGQRTPGPLSEGETGSMAGSIIVAKGEKPVWRGTYSARPTRDLVFKEPLDKGEIGSAYRSYADNG